MPYQDIIVGLAITAALLYLGRRLLRTWSGRCNSNCGCKTTTEENAEQRIASLDVIRR